MMETIEQVRPKTTRRAFPELIYERFGGKTYYRKGYGEVLKNRKTPSEIMGASGLQSLIVSYINWLIVSFINRKLYRVLTNEPGLHLGPNDNMACDVMVFDRAVLTNDKITTKYVDVPPKVAIEVDVKVELKNETEWAYLFRKNEALFAFGAEKVIWVLTDIQQVLVCLPSKEAQFLGWDREVPVVDEVTFNVGRYLVEEGF